MFETLFTAFNAIAIVGWMLLVFAPRWKRTSQVTTIAIPLFLAAAYVTLFMLGFSGASGGFSTLEGVRELFLSDALLLAGWVHYLAFDMLVGAWQVQDSHRANVPHALVVPCLMLTLLIGPAGLLAYHICRSAARERQFQAAEES